MPADLLIVPRSCCIVQPGASNVKSFIQGSLISQAFCLSPRSTHGLWDGIWEMAAVLDPRNANR